ncbi:uncharacterized protein LOC123541446 [Mercenaria mercenaria]|uniref:uncharacterized protein LOC123541446 n=1 Tax=Mercenaria mercenaria TaxID=6596 RepID=UPI00234F9251|nr:uncharacterized protein LOC123541446 [Mercenaria mercenaria]
MCLWIYISLLAVGCVSGEDVCTESSYGKEFIFGFADIPYYDYHGHRSDPVLTILVTSKRSTSFYISLPSTNSASKTPTLVKTRYYAYNYKEVTFNSSMINRFEDTGSRSFIKISSSDDISVLAMYNVNSYVITNPILPVNFLSSAYIVPSYSPNTVTHSKTQLLIVALNDSTSITLQSYHGIYLTKTLKPNEVYMYQDNRDLSGVSINSNHPIAVFSSIVPGSKSFSSHTRWNTAYLSMQVPPIGKYALHFIVPALPNEVQSYKVRIYSPSNLAKVEIHSTSSSTKITEVYERIYYEYNTKGSSTLEIVSNIPIMVVQIALSSTGEAMFMANVPATSQFLSNYWTYIKRPSYSSIPSSESTNTYIVTIRHEKAAGLLFDNEPVLHNPELVAHKTPLGNYSIFTIPMTSRDIVSHAVDEPFGLLVYGRSLTTDSESYSYGHYAGMEIKSDCTTTASPPIVG